MRSLLKMSGLSAVLSFALVTASNQAWPTQPEPSPKVYRDRLPEAGQGWASEARSASPAALPSVAATFKGKGDRLAGAACAEQAWPYIAPTCLAASADGRTQRPVRVITIETREGANTSVLRRVPQADVASR